MSQAETCPVCSTPGESVYTELVDVLFSVPGKWNYDRCSSCGHLWINPIPDAKTINSFYTNYHTHNPPKHPRGFKWKIYRWVLRSSLPNQSTVDLLLRRVLTPFFIRKAIEKTCGLGCGHNRTLLEIGCGNGQNLIYLSKLGWDVHGIEPDPQAARTARALLPDRVQQGHIEDLSPSHRKFDAILLNHVIEHIPFPLTLMKMCDSLLSEGGVIAIATPNGNSLGHQRFQKHWRGLECPRHLHIFTPQSLSLLLKHVGLESCLSSRSSGAKWMWIKSAIISTDGTLHLDQPSHVPMRFKISGQLFSWWESIRINLSPVGEELLCLGSKNHETYKGQ